MHASSMERMRSFRDRYLRTDTPLTIADLGAMDVRGSYRELFQEDGWRYMGVDIAAGPNVDLVLPDPYDWKEVEDGSLDVIISGQAFEHIEYFWLTMQETARALKPGGLACIVAPSSGPMHKYPVDCWRFFPDGFEALAKWAGLETVEVSTQAEDEEWEPDSDQWKDTWGVFRKPEDAAEATPESLRKVREAKRNNMLRLTRSALARERTALLLPRRRTNVLPWHEHIPFAFYIMAVLLPRLVVELGVHKGDSYCAFCQAVEVYGLETRCCGVDTWQGDTHSVTYEEEDVLQDLRTHHDPRYGGFSTLMQAPFDEAVESFKDGAIDLLHIDGFHSYEAVRHDYETWLPKVSDRGVILFHDTAVRREDFGVWRFWEEVSQGKPHLHFPHGNGLGVLWAGSLAPDSVSQDAADLFDMADDEKRIMAELFAALGKSISADDYLDDLEIHREWNASMQAHIADLEKTVREQQETIAEKDAAIWKLELLTTAPLERVAELEARAAELECALQEQQQSLGWKALQRVSTARKALFPPESPHGRALTACIKKLKEK